MAAPLNVSAATATPIPALPYATTQNVNDAGTTYTVWYAYTPPAGDGVIGLFAYGDASAYYVRTRVWTGPAGAPVAWLTFNTVSPFNSALQVPVAAGGVYYFECSSWDGDVTPAVLTLVVDAAPAGTAARGDLAINAETEGYPCVVLDPTTAAVRRFVTPFPTGEYGASLPDGTLCVEDKFADTVSVYADGGMGALVATGALGSASTAQPSVVVGSNRTDRFYLGRCLAAGTTEVYTLTTAGVLSGVRWSLPTTPLEALGVNLADTVLYYAASGYGAPVAAYDLVAGAPLADLAPGLPGYMVMPDLFVLADGSILVGYVRATTAPPSCLVYRYSAAGATLNTYPFNFASTTTVRLACALDDPESFWLKRHRAGGQVTYYHIRSRDGVELAQATGAEFDHGVSSYHFPLDGAVHYGNAASCPFWIIGTTVVPVDPPLRVIRRLRRAPHVAQEDARVFVKTFELDLERGQGLETGQGRAPVVLLRVSRDGGQTWGEEVRMAAPALGDYTARVKAERLGHGRDLVFEVVVSDPIAWSLVGAWLELEGGTS